MTAFERLFSGAVSTVAEVTYMEPVSDSVACNKASGSGANPELFASCMAQMKQDERNSASLDPSGAAAYNAVEQGWVGVLNPFESAGGPIPDSFGGVPTWLIATVAIAGIALVVTRR